MGFFVLRLLRIGKREDERARGEMTDVAFGVIVLAVDVSVEHGNVLIRGEDIHDLAAIGGVRFPVGFEIEERAVGEDDGRRCFWSGDVLLEPGELFGTDFGLGA